MLDLKFELGVWTLVAVGVEVWTKRGSKAGCELRVAASFSHYCYVFWTWRWEVYGDTVGLGIGYGGRTAISLV